MKNWQAFRFITTSPQFVIAHAKLQRSRGKNPSVSYAGIRNPRMALLVAEDVLYMEARAESARAEEVRQRVLTLERRWRDDITTSELPSINFTVKHASDLVCVQGMFALFIHHVDSLPHGRGFKPVLRHGDWTCETGEVHLGTDEQAHIAAQAEGEEILLRQVQDLAAALQQQDILERRFHSPKRPVKKIRK